MDLDWDGVSRESIVSEIKHEVSDLVSKYEDLNKRLCAVEDCTPAARGKGGMGKGGMGKGGMGKGKGRMVTFNEHRSTATPHPRSIRTAGQRINPQMKELSSYSGEATHYVICNMIAHMYTQIRDYGDMHSDDFRMIALRNTTIPVVSIANVHTTLPEGDMDRFRTYFGAYDDDFFEEDEPTRFKPTVYMETFEQTPSMMTRVFVVSPHVRLTSFLNVDEKAEMRAAPGFVKFDSKITSSKVANALGSTCPSSSETRLRPSLIAGRLWRNECLRTQGEWTGSQDEIDEVEYLKNEEMYKSNSGND